jgi:arsenite-transporting ATPase
MVIGEAMRTFTYLNLYGYLTDAVVVNRVFGEEVGDYFAAWRKVQEEHLELVRSAFAPVPVLCAPYFDQEVVGEQMLDRLAARVFAQHDPQAVLHHAFAQQIEVLDTGARVRLELPFARKSEISVKKMGLELIVGVDGQRRTIALPPALAALRPTGATFEDGTLEVTFDADQRPLASDTRSQ